MLERHRIVWRRDFWAGWDLQTPEGLKIEVKAAAYLQAWEQKRPSQIVFSFCVQTETDSARWDALDLSQWRFYLLDQAALAAHGIKSIRLPVLATLSPCPHGCRAARAGQDTGPSQATPGSGQANRGFRRPLPFRTVPGAHREREVVREEGWGDRRAP
jgi:hypothetical protein